MGGTLPPLAAVPASEGSFALQCVRRTFTASLAVSSSEAGADSSALFNGLPSLRSQTLSLHCSRFCCSRSAEERGAAAEDGQASGGMIKREFSMRSWRAGGHFFNLTTAAATDVRDVVEVGIAGVDVRLAQRTTPSFLPSRTRRHLRSPTIVERMDHIRRRRTACELAERK